MNKLNKYLHFLAVPVLLFVFLVSSISVCAAEESTDSGEDTGTDYVYPLNWEYDYYVDTNTGELLYRETSAVTSPYTMLVSNAEHYSIMKQAQYTADGYIAYYDKDYNYLTFQDLFHAGPLEEQDDYIYEYYPEQRTALEVPGNAYYYRVSITCISNDDAWMMNYCLNLFSMHYIKKESEQIPYVDALEEANRLQGENNDLMAEANQLQSEANQQQQQMIDGYDNSAGDDVNDNFSNKSDAFKAAEDSLFGMVNYDQVDYNQYTDWLGLPAVVETLEFIASCMQSIFVSLGDLGVPILIGLVLLIFSRLIGLQMLAGSGKRSGSGRQTGSAGRASSGGK